MKRSISLFILLIIELNLLLVVHAAPVVPSSTTQLEITSGPYLQRADASSMTVMWITSKKCLSWVEVGIDKNQLEKTTNSSNGLTEINNNIHKIRLTNLTPGQRYFYRIVSKVIVSLTADDILYGEEISSEIYEFETLNLDKQEFSFVVLADIHQNMDILDPLLEQATSKNFDLLFYNGDMADYFYSEEQICHDVLNPSVTHFANYTPFVWVRGNHECQGSYARKIINYIDTWDYEYYYSFDHGPVHFLVLDTAEARQDFEEKNGAIGRFEPYRTLEAEWLNREINTDNFKNAKFRIAFCHIPFYISGDTGPEIEEKFGPLLNDGKIDLLICGHTHNFTYLEPNPDRYNFPVIVVGGGTAGSCTLMRVDASNNELVIEMTNINGELLKKVVIPVKE